MRDKISKEDAEILRDKHNWILLVTVNDIETKHTCDSIAPFDGMESKITAYCGAQTYTLGKFGAYSVVHVRSGMGIHENTFAAINSAIGFWDPKALIMIGVAWGAKEEEHNMFDVLVSDAVLPIDNVKHYKRKRQYRGYHFGSGRVLFNRFQSATNDWNYSFEDTSISPQIRTGLILSGSQLVNDHSHRTKLCSDHPNAIGGEMEGATLASIAKDHKLYEWILVKGICDWGYNKDEGDKNLLQEKAVKSAISLCQHVCSNEASLSEIMSYNDKKYKRKRNVRKTHNRNNSKWEPPKIVMFDFDGTLTSPGFVRNTWERLWCELGYQRADCLLYHKMYEEKKISHQKWCDITADHFKKKNVSKHTINSVASQMKMMSDANDVLRRLSSDNIFLYIVSGSIESLIREVLGDELEPLFCEISANRFIFEEGKLSRIIGTQYDFEGKADYVRHVAKKHKVSASDILFIGNSFNDIHVKKTGARTLCINPKMVDPTNKQYWDDYIVDVTLEGIMPYVYGSK